MAITRITSPAITSVASTAISGTLPAANINDTSIGNITALPAGVGGKVLQVVEDASTSALGTTSTSYVSTPFSISITPSSASNKILCLFSSTIETNGSGGSCDIQITRDGTEISDGRLETRNSTSGASSDSMIVLDTPSTTSAVTYAVNFKSSNGTIVVINRGNDRGSFILMEVAG
jgi:hypothetical protein